MGTGGARVLLVEDHDLVAGTLTLALQAKGIEADSTKGPDREAVLAAVRRSSPGLVLLDLDLGVLGSGLDLIAPIRLLGPRVVMLTGVTDRAQLAACVEAGAVGVLSKAVPFEDLLDAVTRLCSGEVDALFTSHQRDRMMGDLLEHRREERKRFAPFAALTSREQAVLARLVAGESAEEVAAASYVSLATVRSQIRSILRKLEVNSQLAAVAAARRAGWPPG